MEEITGSVDWKRNKRSTSYDWNKLLDGGAYRLTLGEDIFGSIELFRSLAQAIGRKRNLRVRTKRDTANGTIIIQSVGDRDEWYENNPVETPSSYSRTKKTKRRSSPAAEAASYRFAAAGIEANPRAGGIQNENRVIALREKAAKIESENTPEKDVLYRKMVNYLEANEGITISGAKREFSIGSIRAGRLIDALVKNGVINAYSPSGDGHKSLVYTPAAITVTTHSARVSTEQPTTVR